MDVVLGKTKLFEGDTCGNLDLGSNDIDTGDLFGDGVLDLDTGVDFDKVVSALLVDKEFGRTGVSVFDGGGELESVVEDGLSNRFVEMRGWSDLDHLRC